MFGRNHSMLEHRISALEKKILELESLLQTQKPKTTATKKDRKAAKNEKLTHTVMDNTGWDYEQAKEAMAHSRKISGAEPKDYVAYRFWELNDDLQKTYFTKGLANALRRKYNTNKANLRYFKNKNEFNTAFADFLGRPWIHTPEASL